jgi:hypothetical protein
VEKMEINGLQANFLTFFEGGRLRITCDNEPSVNFTATKDTKIIDIIDMPIRISGKPGLIKQLSQAKGLAKELKQKNTTLEVRLHGEIVLKLGEKANPKLAKIVTMSDNIEITDLKKLKKLSDVI